MHTKFIDLLYHRATDFAILFSKERNVKKDKILIIFSHTIDFCKWLDRMLKLQRILTKSGEGNAVRQHGQRGVFTFYFKCWRLNWRAGQPSAKDKKEIAKWRKNSTLTCEISIKLCWKYRKKWIFYNIFHKQWGKYSLLLIQNADFYKIFKKQ